MIKSVVVIGDSSSIGFGAGGRNYSVVLAELLGAEDLEVRAVRGMTTEASLGELDSVVDRHPDLIVVQTGMADSLLRPGLRTQRFLERLGPERPGEASEQPAVDIGRPSSQAARKVAAAARTVIRWTAVTVRGGYTWMQPDDSARCLDHLLTRLEATGSLIVCVGIHTIDERVFPRQMRTTIPFVEARQRVLSRHPGILVVQPDDVVEQWGDFLADHGHWNARGHDRVAHQIFERVSRADAARGAPGDTDGRHTDPGEAATALATSI